MKEKQKTNVYSVSTYMINNEINQSLIFIMSIFQEILPSARMTRLNAVQIPSKEDTEKIEL